MSEGKTEHEIGRRIGAASAVMRVLYRTVVVKRELSWKAFDLSVNLCSNPHLELLVFSICQEQKTTVWHKFI